MLRSKATKNNIKDYSPLVQAQNNKNVVVTIDGLAGAGKSTAAREVARKLGFVHINSGAIYRGVAILALRSGVPFEDETSVIALTKGVKFEFQKDADGSTALFLNGKNPKEELLQNDVSRGASKVALHPAVRKFADEVQRAMRQVGSLVVEGRDTGTIVFPDADFKFFLNASSRKRAERRLQQLGNTSDLESLVREIDERDRRDTKRSIAPTVRAEDAVYLDTSEMSADEVVESILRKINIQPVK